MACSHLTVRLEKNNLAYSLLRDKFSVLGYSRCEVLSVSDLKDAFHSLRLLENSERFCGILPYFRSASYLYQKMPMGLNISINMAIIYKHDLCDNSLVATAPGILGI